MLGCGVHGRARARASAELCREQKGVWRADGHGAAAVLHLGGADAAGRVFLVEGGGCGARCSTVLTARWGAGRSPVLTASYRGAWPKVCL